ncbi:hypothetical protein L2E82_45183 [Cichorium intybus]|uniref:Uncharacterized protein n=1 Tax=Cichorium intybus TaxID=13427 RepID=A0ACB8ZSB2_CICIN|nr:hypothetical protein L2E82_45183 [Cichorium intybus]
MGRAPCCEKMGLKKGPWSRDEDQILISYIQQHGHPNWRALPKHAGLLRCGKSCRLRWTNYLRPDIKRGNFSREEEDTIIHLHEMLGNRWSVIATNLPGRTDNEIKNVWHTHLKKRLESDHQTTNNTTKRHKTKSKRDSNNSYHEASVVSQCHAQQQHNSQDEEQLITTQPSCSESSYDIETTTDSFCVAKHEEIENETFLDDSFWSETLSGEGDNMVESNSTSNISNVEFSSSPLTSIKNENISNPYIDCHLGGMDQWYDIFTRIEELCELPEF